MGISTATGATANHMAKKFGFAYDTTDYQRLLSAPDIDAVLILTRHNLHAKMVIEALKAGKHVFVEKPLCLNESQLNQIIDTYSASAISNRQCLC
jgi:predicted dehydrogenase